MRYLVAFENAVHILNSMRNGSVNRLPQFDAFDPKTLAARVENSRPVHYFLRTNRQKIICAVTINEPGDAGITRDEAIVEGRYQKCVPIEEIRECYSSM